MMANEVTADHDILHTLDAALLSGKAFYFSAHISPGWLEVMRRLAEERPRAREQPSGAAGAVP